MTDFEILKSLLCHFVQQDYLHIEVLPCPGASVRDF